MAQLIRALIQLIVVPLACVALGYCAFLWMRYRHPAWAAFFGLCVLAILARRVSSMMSINDQAGSLHLADAVILPATIVIALLLGLVNLDRWLKTRKNQEE